MITDNGTELISKYLAGQAGSYAYSVAIGSGARPLSNTLPIQFNSAAVISAATPVIATNYATGGASPSINSVGGSPGAYTATISGLATGTPDNFAVGDVIYTNAGLQPTALITISSIPSPASTATSITILSNGPISATAITTLYVGGYSATVTVGSGEFVNYIEPGDILTSTTGTGTFGPKSVIVTSITGPRTFTISSDAQIVNGAITLLKTSTGLSSYASQTKLNFEMERFPIDSRSYLVEQQSVECSLLTIKSTNQVVITTPGAHPFVTGDIVFVVNPIVVTGPPLYQAEVRGTYKVVGITETSFTAEIYNIGTLDQTFDISFVGATYVGSASTNTLFITKGFTRQISLTASMTEPSGKSSRYDITEMGIYSLANNNLGKSDVGTVLDFANDNNWTYITSTSQTTIDTQTNINFPFSDFGGAWFVGTSNSWWNPDEITLRQEKPRFKDDALVLAGDLSSYDNATNFTFASTSKYVQYSNFSINLSDAAPSDKLCLAFSIANAIDLPTAIPTDYCIMLEFVSTKAGGGVARIKFANATNTIVVSDALSPYTLYLPVLSGNRYVVLEKNISDIQYINTTANTFNWSDATIMRVYSAIQVSGTATPHYSIILDGFRYNNTVTENPLYALTGYTKISNSTASTLVKDSNTNALINFRLNVSMGA
jgi:hypothetical protein